MSHLLRVRPVDLEEPGQVLVGLGLGPFRRCQVDRQQLLEDR